MWSPALTFSFPLRDRTFHLCSAFGKTERFSGALRQQLGGHMGPRSRHEGAPCSFGFRPPPSPPPPPNRGEVLTRRSGWGPAPPRAPTMASSHSALAHLQSSAPSRILHFSFPPPSQRLIRCQTHTHTHTTPAVVPTFPPFPRLVFPPVWQRFSPGL